MDYDVRIISSMEKVLPLGGMQNSRLVKRIIGFLGQRVSFQAAYCFHGESYNPKGGLCAGIHAT